MRVLDRSNKQMNAAIVENSTFVSDSLDCSKNVKGIKKNNQVNHIKEALARWNVSYLVLCRLGFVSQSLPLATLATLFNYAHPQGADIARAEGGVWESGGLTLHYGREAPSRHFAGAIGGAPRQPSICVDYIAGCARATIMRHR
jgi:hypothetical protein